MSKEPFMLIQETLIVVCTLHNNSYDQVVVLGRALFPFHIHLTHLSVGKEQFNANITNRRLALVFSNLEIKPYCEL